MSGVRVQSARAQAGRVPGGGESPVRTIKDPYPSFAGVSVDPVRNEVVFTDESLFQVLVYDRMENTPAGAAASKPKRVIVGEKTNIEFQSSAWVDSKTGEIYAVNNDTRDTTVVFGAGANGNAAPVRSIQTPHGSFGIAAAEAHDEVLMTIQHDSAIVAYKKNAGENDSPIRLLQGLATKLADPHGIAYDPQEDVIFVANFGATHDVSPGRTGGRDRRGRGADQLAAGPRLAVPGSGTINKPSISVHRRLATGNEPPAPGHRGPRGAIELADRACLRSGQPGALCRQRHGAVDSGLRRRSAGECRAEESPQGIPYRACESDRVCRSI